MYLHLGQDTVVRMRDVIGIFDLDTATISRATRNYLARATREGEVINVTYDLPKSFVVCIDQEKKTEGLYFPDFFRDIIKTGGVY